MLLFVGDRSYIVSGREAEEIHRQNVVQLESLSSTEIEQEQQRLKSQLNSTTIAFLMSRRKGNENLKQIREQEQMSSVKSNFQQSKVEDIAAAAKDLVQAAKRKKAFSNSLSAPQPEQDVQSCDLLATLPINPNEAKQWLHMDVIEKDKLEWMKNLPPMNKNPGLDEPYAARFDFQGILLKFFL